MSTSTTTALLMLRRLSFPAASRNCSSKFWVRVSAAGVPSSNSLFRSRPAIRSPSMWAATGEGTAAIGIWGGLEGQARRTLAIFLRLGAGKAPQRRTSRTAAETLSSLRAEPGVVAAPSPINTRAFRGRGVQGAHLTEVTVDREASSGRVKTLLPPWAAPGPHPPRAARGAPAGPALAASQGQTEATGRPVREGWAQTSR